MKPGFINPLGEEQAQRVAWLIAGYLRQTLKETEQDELDEWISKSDENQRLFEEMTDPVFIERGLQELEQTDGGAALNRIRKKLNFSKQVRRNEKTSVWIYRVAASLLLIAALFFAYKLMNLKPQTKDEVVETNILQPGGNYAVLSLGDGKWVNLHEAKNGLIDTTGGSDVLKTAEGQLSYENALANESYHTLTTPPGGQYCVLLQDGSRVWLNASSSLRYPATFNGAERVVELRGEGYFEIAPVESPGAEKKKGPFIVKTEGMTVKVLGTRFNINAYKDEEIITTTLLEGSVSLSGRNQPGSAIRILKPGEQAKLYADEVIQVLENVDIEETVAWKNGQFKFNDARIETVMRQVSRWYDAEIVYRGTVNYHFNATIYRHEPVTKLLKVLEETDRVHFTIEGKKIIVRP